MTSGQSKRDSLALVLDPTYGPKLEQLHRRHMLWVVYSPENQVAVERLWKRLRAVQSGDMSVTIGSECRTLPDTKVLIEEMLASVVEHFPDLARIVVVSGDPVDRGFADDEMMVYGYVRDASVVDAVEYVRRKPS